MKQISAFALIFALALVMVKCKSSNTNMREQKEIPFEVARGYFLKNDAENVPESLTTEEDFLKYFHYAPVMGPNAGITKINFGKKMVIPVIRPVTNHATRLMVDIVSANSNTLVVRYREVVGAEQTFTVHPNLIIVVDKKYKGHKVVLDKFVGPAR